MHSFDAYFVCGFTTNGYVEYSYCQFYYIKINKIKAVAGGLSCLCQTARFLKGVMWNVLFLTILDMSLQKKQDLQIVSDYLVEALEAFLEKPPVGVPAPILKAFSEAVDASTTKLPPQIFFEAVEQASIAISMARSRAKTCQSVSFSDLRAMVCTPVCLSMHLI